MANEEHLEILKQGTEAWNRWRRENPEAEPDLAEANLARAELVGAHLNRANLSHADLAGANLNQANLEGADLEGANLVGANLEGAELNRARLTRATLFEAELRRANLVEATLSEAELVGAKLTAANLEQADLGEAKLVRANLGDADLVGASLEGAQLKGASLQGSDLEGADLVAANLEGANLEGANLEGANLEGANLEGANLLQTNLQDADLRGTLNVRLNETFIRGARFSTNAKDPWSVLRRNYTGLMFLFHFLFLLAFLLPYVSRTLLWIGINHSQEALTSIQDGFQQQLLQVRQSDDQALGGLVEDLRGIWTENDLDEEEWALVEDSFRQAAIHRYDEALAGLTEELGKIAPCLQEECAEPRPVWQVLLSVQEGWERWALALALILYNVVRAIFTRQVALLSAAEDRSGYSPRWKEYRWLFWTHPILLGLFVFAVTSLLVHGWFVLVRTTVVLPVGLGG